MSRRICAGFMASLLVLLILSFLRVAYSTGQPEIAVVNVGNADSRRWTTGPPRWVETNGFIFFTNETEINSTFYIEIRAYNVVDLLTWQINLSFNVTLLRCTEAWLPAAHVFAGREVMVVPPLIDNNLGHVTYGASLLGEPTFTGNGTLCWVGFQIVKAPIGENETLIGEFTFDYPGETFLINSRDEEIIASPVNGHYEFRYPPRLTGDINLDSVVDMRDIGDVCAKFGTNYATPSWSPQMDLNGDLRVDLRDIGIVCVNFGRTF